MNKQIEKIKNHFSENKVIYFATTGGIVIGVVGSFMVFGNGRNIIDSLKIELYYKSSKTNINQVLPSRLGHPGYVIRCIETDKLFPSQNNTAKIMDINPRLLSSYLNGKTITSNINGYTFERLGEAVSADNE